MENKMRIVVFSCDNYLWLSPIFLHFYKKNWPDNPYQTEFMTETVKVEGEETLCVGKIPWATKMLNYLKTSKESLFLFLLIDYIIDRAVNTDRIRYAESLCKGDIGCVRLNAHDSLGHFLIESNIEGFKEYPLDKPYPISLQPAIWQKKFFLEFLKKGENIWQSETVGLRRIQKSKMRVIWSDTVIIGHHNPPAGYMQKGKIIESTERWVGENW